MIAKTENFKKFLRWEKKFTQICVQKNGGDTTNTRAIHVYEKVGFKITGEFIASWHPVPHYQMELNMEELCTK